MSGLTGIQRGLTGVLALLAVLLMGCEERQVQVPSIYPTLESLAKAMVDAINRNDRSGYEDCFTFAELSAIPGDVAPGDLRPWEQVEVDRSWLHGELMKNDPVAAPQTFMSLRIVSVQHGRVNTRLATRQTDSSIFVLSLDAVMTDHGWRFIPVRDP